MLKIVKKNMDYINVCTKTGPSVIQNMGLIMYLMRQFTGRKGNFSLAQNPSKLQQILADL